MDLSAQEVHFPGPHDHCTSRDAPFAIRRLPLPSTPVAMSPATALGLALLVLWGAVTLGTEAPGLVHLLLTAGVFLVVYGMVTRGTPGGPRSGR